MRKKITCDVWQSDRNFGQTGQIVLIILLIMVVGLTVGLAAVARSITSVKITTQEEQSQRAFYAAEAGLEASLLAGGGAVPAGSFGSPTIARYQVTVAEPYPTGVFSFPGIVKKDETETIWLVEHDNTGNIKAPSGSDGRYPIGSSLDVCWSGSGSGVPPALEMILFHQSTVGQNLYDIKRAAFDPADPPAEGARRNNNNFTDVTSDAGGQCGSFQYRQQVTFQGGSPTFNIPGGNQRLVILRLRPMYNDARIAVQGASQLPPQRKEIESVGTSGDPTSSEVTRKIKVFRSYPSTAPIFDFVLFSGTALTK